MCNSKKHQERRTCIVCEREIYGRSDKVFCDIRCKNHYHAEIRKSARTISAETIRSLHKNWEILTSLIGASSDHLVMNKLALARHGFNFNAVSAVSVNGLQLRFNVFEFIWYAGKHDNIHIRLNKKQESVSPFLFKRWKYKYSQDLNATA